MARRVVNDLSVLVSSLSLVVACGTKRSFNRDENINVSTQITSTDTATDTPTDTSINTNTEADSTTSTTTVTQTDTSVIGEPVCSEQANVLRGAHILLLVDNSTSMRWTDCPMEKNGQCGSRTAREQTVLDVLASLQKIESESRDKEISRSSIAIARFTVNEVSDEAQLERDLILSPTWASSVNVSRLQKNIRHFNQPQGDTPYRNAVQLAEKINDSLQKTIGKTTSKPIIVVMITDGEPTDRNPASVRELGRSFKSRGAKWYSLMVTPTLDRQERLSAHRNIMLDYNKDFGPRLGGTWFTSNYSSFDEYWRDLIALPGQLADKEIIVPTSDLMSPAILNEVIAKEFICVDSR